MPNANLVALFNAAAAIDCALIIFDHKAPGAWAELHAWAASNGHHIELRVLGGTEMAIARLPGGHSIEVFRVTP